MPQVPSVETTAVWVGWAEEDDELDEAEAEEVEDEVDVEEAEAELVEVEDELVEVEVELVEVEDELVEVEVEATAEDEEVGSSSPSQIPHSGWQPSSREQ